jgi:hypothetical protein
MWLTGLVEVTAGLLVGGPRACAVLAVPVVEASDVVELACGVPGQARMPPFELLEGEDCHRAVLPVGVKADLVQQAYAARPADPVADVAERLAAAGDRELGGRYLMGPARTPTAPGRCMLNRMVPTARVKAPVLAGQLPGQHRFAPALASPAAHFRGVQCIQNRRPDN